MSKTIWGIVTVVSLLVAIGVFLTLAILFTKRNQVVDAFKVDKETGNIRLFKDNGDEVLNGVLGVILPAEDGLSDCPKEGYEVCMQWPNVATVRLKQNSHEGRIRCTDVFWQAETRDENDEAMAPLQDCYNLGEDYWYGSAEMFYQHWPIDEWNETMTMYVSGDMYANHQDYGSVLERYWVSSNGVAIRASHDSPLHVSLNDDGDRQVCFRSTYTNSYYPNEDNDPPHMNYTICTAPEIRRVHDFMSLRYVTPPAEIPDERMIQSPIWSTWARFKIFINESVILDYADEITSNGFSNSQLEIDDGYQTKYGDFTFDPEKFSDPAAMVTTLHEKGFRVTMWVTPFANLNSEAYDEGAALGYFVKKKGQDTPGNVLWWNGIAGMLDVTNPAAVDWFVNRLEKVRQDIGIDSFKFDAGETNYLVTDFDTFNPIVNPCEYTTLHAEMAARLGGQVEIRAAFENQNLPIFLRMMDKDSKWGWDNGVKTLITTTLTFSTLGYPYILPDMIGGNVYEGGFHDQDKPDRELYIRWLELTAFLPSMQFSISPWQYDEEVVTIAKKWVDFHEEIITPKLIQLAKLEAVRGYPLIRTLWWLAPEDPETFAIDSQFMVGSDLLVAPIVSNATRSRDIYLPKMKVHGDETIYWVDTANQQYPATGTWLRGVEVPLDEVPYYQLVISAP